MTQNIECTNCHDIIALEGGRTIVIPYTCGTCLTEVEQTAKSLSLPKYAASAEGEPSVELDHEYATVENTTLLIDDLQEQLTTATDTVSTLIEKLTQAEEFISAEVDRSTKFLEDLTQLTQRNAELQLENDGLRIAAAKLLKAFLEKIEI